MHKIGQGLNVRNQFWENSIDINDIYSEQIDMNYEMTGEIAWLNSNCSIYIQNNVAKFAINSVVPSWFFLVFKKKQDMLYIKWAWQFPYFMVHFISVEYLLKT